MMQMSEDSSNQNAQLGQNAPKLSCTNCRQRKIKCNKMTPCFHCHTSGRQCVYPHRRRRQATKHHEGELFARVRHLESLLGQIGASTAPADSRDELTTENAHDIPALIPGSVNTQIGVGGHGGRLDDQCLAFVERQEVGSQYLGHTFWTSLSLEVGGLRKLLEDTADDEDEIDHMASNSPDNNNCSPHFLFDDPGTVLEPKHPSDLHRSTLIRFYFSNVHPLCKILHWPTASVYLDGATQSVDQASGVYNKCHGLEAVTFAVYFAAVTSMSAVDCVKYLGAEKGDLVMWYRRNLEAALSHADFMNSTEIATLQAFTLYIMAMRSHNSSRSSWTLIGVAVRIAHDLGLHRDGDGRAFTPFDAEMRRRLWWEILVLDVRASEDRGSEPMILDGSFNTIMPHNLNDEDFGLASRTLPSASSGITEMAFCLICMDVSNTILKISFIPPFKERRVLTFTQKEEIVKECSERIDSIYLGGSAPSDPNTWVVRTIGQLLILKLWLVVQYPLQCVHSTSQHFAKGQSLRTVTAYLNICQLLEDTDSATGFLWLFATYVPWHALAVALAELCKETGGPLADRAWSIIDKGYGKWGDRMADTKGGMLWRPIKSLMKKARAAREQGEKLAEPQAVSSQPTSEPALTASNIGLDILNLNLGANQSHSLDPFLFGNFEPIPPTTYPSFGQESLNSMDINLLTTDQSDNSSNWDHWNEFLFDVGAAYGDSHPNPEGMWP